MNNHQFKPFDKVLVRDLDQGNWKVGIYSHYEKESTMPYACIGSYYTQCIPYNENTAHLVGTNDPYEPPIPKEWLVINTRLSFDKEYTTDEFIEFIKNNDLSIFTVKRIKPNNQPDSTSDLLTISLTC